MGNNNKSDIEYLLKHGQVNSYAVDDVLTHTDTKRQSSFWTELQDFTVRPLVILKQLQSSMAVMGEKWGRINNIVVTPQ